MLNITQTIPNPFLKSLLHVVAITVIFWFSFIVLPGLLTFVESSHPTYQGEPWNFIISDLKSGIAGITVIVLSFAYMWLVMDRKSQDFMILLFIIPIFSLLYLYNGLKAMYFSSNILDPELASTVCKTNAEYLQAKIPILLLVTLLVPSLLAVGYYFYTRRHRNQVV